MKKKVPSLAPSDTKVYTRVRKPPVRSPGLALISVVCPAEMKLALQKRAAACKPPADVSPMIVMGLEYLEKTNWKGVL